MGESRLRSFLASPRGFALGLAVVLAGLAFGLFLDLAADPVERSSELRCVEVVRHMVESGEFLVPHFGDRVRLQKPPLFYWAGAAVATLVGDTGPWSLRAVSACAALGLTALVALWGARLDGRGAGLLAGALLAAMLQVHSSGRRGDAEMLLALLSTAALFTFDRIAAERWRGGLAVFAVLAALAFLTKATAIALSIALPILVYLALQRELAALRDRGVWACVAAALALGMSWYLAVLALVPGAFDALRDALLLPLGSGDARGGSAHFRPVTWFFAVLPARALPTSLLLPLVVWRLWATRLYRGDGRRRFAALALLVPFVAFSLLPQKQKHYTLAMLPGLALTSADALGAAARSLGARFHLVLRGLALPLALAGAAATILVALFLLWIDQLSPLASAACVALPLAAFALACAAALAGRPASTAAAWLVGFLVLFGLGRGAVQPRIESLVRNYTQLSLDDRERLVALSREHPWFARLLFWVQAQTASEEDP
ncbi:MAG TPA: glycosyltransferase family 39 protein [Myxococcota bacterium]|nr:glycosyltransferase family 39 protein [Myxococcota bacterium]